MNLLPLVTTFILLFSIATYSFFHHTQNSLAIKKETSIAFMEQEKRNNAIQKSLYKKQKGKILELKESSSPKKSKKFKSTRDEFPPTPKQKLSLRPLLTKNPPERLQTIALNLLKNLYQKAPFYHPGWEKQVLEKIMATLKEHPKIDSFEELYAHLPQEELPLFYKLLKGTHHYTLYENKGYPPLPYYLRLDKKNGGKALHVRTAVRPVLEAAFGFPFTLALLQEEKIKQETSEKKESLTKDELEALFLKHRISLIEIQSFIDLSGSKH